MKGLWAVSVFQPCCMLSKFLGKNTYHKLLFTGYLGLSVGLPLSKIVLSLSTMWVLLMLLLEADFKVYGKNIRTNKTVLLLLAFLALHLLSFLWSADLQYALKDLNAKLPLYLIPIAFAAYPFLTRKLFMILLGGFVVSVFFTSVFNYGSYLHWWGNRVYDDIRGMSLFLSHIRYSLMVTMSAAISVIWVTKKTFPYRWIGALLFIWFAYYTYYAQILSGVMTFAGILIVLLILEVIRRKNRTFTAITVSFGILITAAITYGLVIFFKPQEMKVSLDNLPWVTKQGNRYYYMWGNLELENGYPIYYFLCQEEMKTVWNERSEIPYDSLDLKGQLIEATIIRYVTSKGLRKDAEGIHALSDKDVRNIEMGVPTIVGLNGGFLERLSGLKTELFHTKDPNGQSVSQRFIYWKTGLKIIQKHWLTGVGSGDIDRAFQQQYMLDKSPLKPEYRLRSHNQYISYMVSFGITGLVLFLWILGRFWTVAYRQRDRLALLFMTISMLSFLVEDTLETQMGVTFFAFFFGLFASFKRERLPRMHE